MFTMDELHELFLLPCESVLTNGISYGVVLKFKTFYLKIYNDASSSGYIIQAYLYHKTNPVYIDKIEWTRFREYARQYTEEDYLRGMIMIHSHE